MESESGNQRLRASARQPDRRSTGARARENLDKRAYGRGQEQERSATVAQTRLAVQHKRAA